MKKKLCFVFLALVIPQIILSQNVIDNKSIKGSWLGKLNAGGVTLRVVFNLSLVGKDSIAATLDSPDQGAKNIIIGPVFFDGNNLDIKAPILLGEYKGTLKNDTLFEGTWSQSGRSTDLNLTRLRSAFTLNRPQEPKSPFPYISEDVTFTNEKFNIDLAGTLTIPKGEGPFPAVVMITGSGAQNRNEELMGHKPFWVIADYLTRNGIAVLRYDDRGIGESKGNFASASSADLATDAEAAFNFLKTTSKINQDLIGLAGHSEGGIIAPIVAATNPGIAFIVSIAGTGVKGEDIIHRQNYDIGIASGANEKDLEKIIKLNRKIFAVLKREPDNKKAEEKMTRIFIKELKKLEISQEEEETALKQYQNSIGTLTSPWYRYFLLLDPSVYWKRVKCPVLVINGEKDLQVNADINLKAIDEALKSGGNKSVKTIKFKELNHLFQHSKTGLTAEYGEIEETFSSEVLKIIGDWILDLK